MKDELTERKNTISALIILTIIILGISLMAHPKEDTLKECCKMYGYDDISNNKCMEYDDSREPKELATTIREYCTEGKR